MITLRKFLGSLPLFGCVPFIPKPAAAAPHKDPPPPAPSSGVMIEHVRHDEADLIITGSAVEPWNSDGVHCATLENMAFDEKRLAEQLAAGWRISSIIHYADGSKAWNTQKEFLLCPSLRSVPPITQRLSSNFDHEVTFP